MSSRPTSAAHRRSTRVGRSSLVVLFLCAGLVGSSAGVVIAVRAGGPAPVSVPATSTSVEPRAARVESRDARVESRLPRVESRVARRNGGAAEVMAAAELLRRWDQRRARAYARGSVGELESLYVAGSQAGTADVSMLRTYLRRDLRVIGMRMQLLRVEVLAHDPDRWVLRVTDRLQRAVAVDGARRLILPRDEATSRVITLRRHGFAGDWRVASVR